MYIIEEYGISEAGVKYTASYSDSDNNETYEGDSEEGETSWKLQTLY